MKKINQKDPNYYKKLFIFLLEELVSKQKNKEIKLNKESDLSWKDEPEMTVVNFLNLYMSQHGTSLPEITEGDVFYAKLLGLDLGKDKVFSSSQGNLFGCHLADISRLYLWGDKAERFLCLIKKPRHRKVKSEQYDKQIDLFN